MNVFVHISAVERAGLERWREARRSPTKSWQIAALQISADNLRAAG